MNYLLIVEGEKAEPKLFESIFSRYGFSVVRHPRPDSLKDYCFDPDLAVNFSEVEIRDDRSTIHIIQAPNNCIEGFIHKAMKEDWDLSKAFGKDTDYFSGKFLVFDVDHAPDSELQMMMDRYCDETDQGLLIISSPCLEVISEPRRKDPIVVKTPSEYKKNRNIALQEDPQIKMGALDYIILHFDSFMKEFLDANVELFQKMDVMEHPHLAVAEVIRHSYRGRDEVRYGYCTSVIYVIIGFIMGYTKQFNNAIELKTFFERMSQQKRHK